MVGHRSVYDPDMMLSAGQHEPGGYFSSRDGRCLSTWIQWAASAAIRNSYVLALSRAGRRGSWAVGVPPPVVPSVAATSEA